MHPPGMNTYRFSRLFVALFIGAALALALVLLLSSLPHAQAKSLTLPAGATRYVSTSGDDTDNECTIVITPCRTVQRAMQVAQDSDEILVATGTFTETMVEFIPAWSDYATATVVITKNITALLGGYSPDFTTRDPDVNETILSAIASPGDWVIFITGTSTLVDGFTVTGSDGSNTRYGGGIRVNGGTPTISGNRIQGNSAFKSGGGIYVTDNAAPIIHGNLIYSNTAENGGGIYIGSGTPIISGNQILSNTALYNGGGILILDRLTAGVIVGNVISGNTADAGGGIYIDRVDAYTITDNLITSNRVISSSDGVVQGGGIYIANWDWRTPSAGYIYNNLILSNIAAPGHSSSGSGIQLAGNVSPLVLSNTIQSNEGQGGGGAISMWNAATPSVRANWILSNTGGGIGVDGGSFAAISGNLIAHNQALTSDGGGLYVTNSSTAMVESNDILRNAAGDAGGGIAVDNHSAAFIKGNRVQSNSTSGWAGGGLMVTDYAAATILSNEIVSNTALSGWGGGIRVNKGSWVTITNNTINGNSAQGAGGIEISNINSLTVTIAGNQIAFNEAVQRGGGIYVYSSTATIANNDILLNTADTGGGICVDSAPGLLVDRNTLMRNKAVQRPGGLGRGGAMYITNTSSGFTVMNNVIARNTVLGTGSSYGSGIYSWQSSGTFINNTFASNGDPTIYGSTALFSYGVGPIATVIRNNVAVGHYMGIEAYGSGVVDHNDVFSATFAAYSNVEPGDGAISADPQFVNVAADDYHIRFGSPVMDRGTGLGAPTYDKDGMPRPQGGGLDMGAYEVKAYTTYQPVMLKMEPGIYGRISYRGHPVSGINIRLWRSGYIAVLTATTQADGGYIFRGVPSLLPGQEYYVFYANSNVYNNTPNPNYLSWWQSFSIKSYTAGDCVAGGDFDIADIPLVSPAESATVVLPYTFQWTRRTVTPSDSYRVAIEGPNGYNSFVSPLLGHVGSFTLSSLPSELITGVQNSWYVYVQGPGGGYGRSYMLRHVTFSP